MADSSKDFAKMKVADLKRELKLRGLSTAGNKQELQERLQLAATEAADSSLLLLEDGPVADAEDILNEDDVLAEDDDDDDDDDGDLDETVPDDGCASSSLKRHLDELDEELDSGVTSSPEAKDGAGAISPRTDAPPAKKIVLNRKGPVAVPASPPGKENVAVTKSDDSSDKKVIKLSAISMKERLELRAAKFGTPASDVAKKEARAARFGGDSSTTTSSTTSPSATGSSGTAPGSSAEVLKKRAERFGLLPGSAAEKVEIELRKQKRLERFGSNSVATNGSSTVQATEKPAEADVPKSNKVPISAPTGGDASLEEKKRLRAERFKTAA